MGKKRKHNGVAVDAEAPGSVATKETVEPTEKLEIKTETLNEIDEIFAKTRKTKTRDVRGSNPAKDISLDRHEDDNEHEVKRLSEGEGNDKIKKKKKTKKPGGKEWRDPPPRPRRKTNDGFTVYSAEELRFNKKDAGGTYLCPFDCDCCF